MNPTHSLKLLLTVATLALAGTVSVRAQSDATAPNTPPADAPERPAHRGGPRPPLPPEIREKYDVNKDGKLDETERAALKADIDSGKVTLPKRGPGGPGGPDGKGGKGHKGGPGAAGRPVPPEVLAKYDANKDGKLDETERAKLHADIESGAFVPPHRPHGRPSDAPADAAPKAPADDQGASIVPKRPRN
jgi:hypothetical protein